ncbi:MAG: FapA family protein [Oscillospiraceae bacterium]|nr:FapA family protein [Oscillospiraceae bacterium]
MDTEKKNPTQQPANSVPAANPMAANASAMMADQSVRPEHTIKLAIQMPTNAMSADVMITPISPGMPEPLQEEVEAKLKAEIQRCQITFGLDERVMDMILRKPPINRPVTLANGQEPVHGESARIEYMIDLKRNIRPKILEDGTADYKDLGIVQNVSSGDLLARKIPATLGTPGTNIRGMPVPAKPGRDVPLPAGKNTVLSEDRLELFASIDGQVNVAGKKVSVDNTFTVRGGVGNATGNIDFVGNVDVQGNVLSGFSIKATGNITISGSVESANLEAGGNIVIREGLNGFEKGMVTAGGDVICKYVQAANIQATGCVEANYILHSRVQSGDTVRILGNKGMLVGGHISAFKLIESANAGGRNTLVNTILEVGTDQNTQKRYQEVPDEIITHQKDIATLNRVVSLLKEHQRRGSLNPEKEEQLNRAVTSLNLLTENLVALEEEFETIKQNLESFGFGVITITDTVYPGVRIFIGSESMQIESKYQNCSFTRDTQGIQAGPCRTS